MCFHLKPLKDSQLLIHSYIPTPTLMQTVKTRRQRWNSYSPCEMSVSWLSGSHQNVCPARLPCSQPQSLLLASRQLCFPASFGPLHLCPEEGPGHLPLICLWKSTASLGGQRPGKPLHQGSVGCWTHSGKTADAGELRKASRKWCCLGHVWSGWGKEGFSRQR